jgi:branched-chain amino acid transport system substrate-binding protein
MAVSENAHLQGVLLACDEVNNEGGISGRPLDPILLDPEGDDRRYAEMATELLLTHRVNFIFGCCLSSSRQAVLPIVERFNGVLFYPSVYEGFEYSPNVIYGGSVPNQIVVPLLEHIFKNHGSRFALVGTDTLYAREINRIVKEFLSSSGGEVLCERYLPVGLPEGDARTALSQAMALGADVVFSTVVGEDSVTLYSCYADLAPEAGRAPIASLTTTESELARMSEASREGHITVAPYFSTLDTPDSQRFVGAFRKRFGAASHPGTYAEVGYSLVHIFANACRIADEPDTDAVLAALSGAVFKAPSGDLFLDLETNHFTLRPMIGRSARDGQFEILWKSPNVVRPDPYLISYDRSINSRVSP